jgi:hypothetical protein
MPEHLKTREDIIAWVISLMADAANWEKDFSLGSSHNFCYTPMVKDRGFYGPMRPNEPGPGTLYVRRDNGLYGNGGYNLGLYGEHGIYVCDTWSILAQFNPQSRKFMSAFWNIVSTLEDAKASAERAANEVSYRKAIEKMSDLVEQA